MSEQDEKEKINGAVGGMGIISAASVTDSLMMVENNEIIDDQSL